jgi:glycosyltransferase involved in cell wall biosynthesis
MRIVFLCGSLEPGIDGVGDYTRRLGGELVRMGHTTSIISLNDSSIENALEDEQVAEEAVITVLRLPSNLSWKTRMDYAKRWIEKSNPDWISLQFVPFSFHKKGLPFFLFTHLRKIGEGRKWHIMFHELWVGMAKASPFKYLIWAKLQQRIIRNLTYELEPHQIHAQSKLYNSQLEKINIKSEYLPLFSNIKKIDSSEIPTPHEKKPSIIVFGTIHPNAPIHNLSKEISAFCKLNNTELIVKFIGRTGAEQKLWQKVMQDEGLNVEVFGEQPAEVISEKLSEAKMGISTTSLSHIEKSGTVAAMLEHGLPVLCVSEKNEFKEAIPFTVPEGIVEYESGNFKSVFTKSFNIQFNNSVSRVASRFIESLNDVKNKTGKSKD